MLYPVQNNVRNRLDLSGIWDFKTDPEEVGERNGWFNGLSGARPMAVPGSWNDQYEDLYLYLGMGWYVRTTYIPQAWKDRAIASKYGAGRSMMLHTESKTSQNRSKISHFGIC